MLVAFSLGILLDACLPHGSRAALALGVSRDVCLPHSSRVTLALGSSLDIPLATLAPKGAAHVNALALAAAQRQLTCQ